MYPGAKPRHASTGWYWVANLLLLTWPYRVWLDSICQRRRYEYVKEIVHRCVEINRCVGCW